MDTVNQVLIAMRRMVRAIDLHSRKLMQLHGLTVPQLVVLQGIAEHQPVTVSELAKRVSLSQATVTNILTRLKAKELAMQEQSKTDRRKSEVLLTAQGQSTVENAPPLLHDKFTSRFQKLDVWEQHMLLASVERLAQLMDSEDLDAAPLLSPGLIDESEKAGGKSSA